VGHLTRSDISFLGSVGSESHALADLVNLATDLDRLAESEGLDISTPALDALGEDDSPEAFAAARHELQAVIGLIGRGEHLTEEGTDDA
jgi:hypothetical protein